MTVEWIDVRERLPERDGRYLVWRTESVQAECDTFYAGHFLSDYCIGVLLVTHWSELPRGPKAPVP